MRRTSLTVLAGALGGSAIAFIGCSSGSGSTLGSGSDHYGSATPNGDTASGAGAATPQPGPGGTPPATASAGDDGGAAVDAGNAVLDNRVLDYGEALRTASLKLVGDLPTLAQIQAIASATTPAQQATLYAADVQAMLADPRFSSQMIQYFRDTFKTGEPYAGAPKGSPSFDTAATFAAMVVVNGEPYTELLTAATGTCPTFKDGTFTAANCTNNAPTAGVLTDPGIQAQYFEHMAFRRIRWVQETFVCSPFPAEYSSTPTQMGQALYTSPWPFDSIAGGPTAQINFQDTSSVICANCHTTSNHMAPLFAYFDANGLYHAGQIQVQTPVTVPVTSVLSDWLPAGQGFAWRDGTAVTDIPSFGQAMAADPDIPQCAVNRVWDWAFNRGDIVLNLATIPNDVTAQYVTDFTKNGMNLKTIIGEIFTSDDFVRF
jgi:hypothetical protein